MSDNTLIVHSMFPDIVPSKLNVTVPYEIIQVSNYRPTPRDNGRNIAAVQCLNRWPAPSGSGTSKCKGKASVYHYQWMDSGCVIRCNKCGCIWAYDKDTFEYAHRSRYVQMDGTDEQYPLIVSDERR